jgi:hypothetical protein
MHGPALRLVTSLPTQGTVASEFVALLMISWPGLEAIHVAEDMLWPGTLQRGATPSRPGNVTAEVKPLGGEYLKVRPRPWDRCSLLSDIRHATRRKSEPTFSSSLATGSLCYIISYIITFWLVHLMHSQSFFAILLLLCGIWHATAAPVIKIEVSFPVRH